MTYVWEQYLFHYISEGGFTYLVMADESAERFVAYNIFITSRFSLFLARRMPFAFLADLQRKVRKFRDFSAHTQNEQLLSFNSL